MIEVPIRKEILTYQEKLFFWRFVKTIYLCCCNVAFDRSSGHFKLCQLEVSD